MPSLELPPDRTAPARARHFVADAMRASRCDEARIPDATLLVSEIVTNAVLHARSATRCSIDIDDGVVRVSVWDASAARPRVRTYTPDAVTGRGLVLVERIASRWGVDMERDGKSVWFEIDTRRVAGADGQRA